MNKVDNYINSIFRDVNNLKLDELKEEMKIHLIAAISELQLEGKTEEEATDIAIERFGEPNILTKKLLGKLRKRVHIAKWMLRVALFFLIAGLLGGTYAFVRHQQYNTTELQIKQLIAAHDGKTELTEQDKVELKEVIEKDPVYSRVNYFAVSKRPVMGWEAIYGEEQLNSRGFYSYLGAVSQDWQVEFQYRGYEILIYYLIFPPIFIVFALLLFIVGKILNAANRNRLYISS